MTTATEIRQAFQQNQYDDLLEELYGDSSLIEVQRERYSQGLSRYAQLFDEHEEIQVYSVGGRSQFAGMHTDTQHGKVISATINLDTIAFVHPSQEMVIDIVSQDFDMEQIDVDDTIKRIYEARTTEGIIRGVVEYFKRHHWKVGGFKAYITSDVLAGAHLSWLASFEVLIAKILSSLYNEDRLTPLELAQAASFAENKYYMLPGSIKNQYACAAGGMMEMDFQSLDEPKIYPIQSRLADFDMSLCLVKTKENPTVLLKEIKKTAQELSSLARYFGESVLRDVEPSEFMASIPALKEEFNDSILLNALHFFNDLERIPALYQALEKKDKAAFLDLLLRSSLSANKSHSSLLLALALCENAMKEQGICRIHGEGEEGLLQAYVPNSHLSGFIQEMETVFGKGAVIVLKIRRQPAMRIIA